MYFPKFHWHSYCSYGYMDNIKIKGIVYSKMFWLLIIIHYFLQFCFRYIWYAVSRLNFQVKQEYHPVYFFYGKTNIYIFDIEWELIRNKPLINLKLDEVRYLLWLLALTLDVKSLYTNIPNKLWEKLMITTLTKQ